PTYWRLIPPAALLLSLAGLAPYARAERLVGIARTSDAAGNSDQRKKSAHENDFLLFGTVFTEPGFALPGAAIRVRRADQKHMRSDFAGGAGCGWRLGGRSEARISVAHRSGHGGGQTGCAHPFERGLPEKPAHPDRENPHCRRHWTLPLQRPRPQRGLRNLRR